MGIEIERKYLLSAVPDWLEECRSEMIEQGYLSLEDEVEVRLRRRGDGHRLTVKSGRGLVRGEQEIELAADQFEALWPLTEGRRVLKRRYLRESSQGTFEIDVFEGELAGLLMAEMEFSSVEASEEFDPPGWLGAEVSADRRYVNRCLATEGLPE